MTLQTETIVEMFATIILLVAGLVTWERRRSRRLRKPDKRC
jgi:predicted small integral membrane protein